MVVGAWQMGAVGREEPLVWTWESDEEWMVCFARLVYLAGRFRADKVEERRSLWAARNVSLERSEGRSHDTLHSMQCQKWVVLVLDRW